MTGLALILAVVLSGTLIDRYRHGRAHRRYRRDLALDYQLADAIADQLGAPASRARIWKNRARATRRAELHRELAR